MRPGHDARIAHLFRRGSSLDLVAELGALYGWTRADAKGVLVQRGWALTWNGRLQPQFMREVMVTDQPIADAEPERLLNAGTDHEVAEIRKAARAVERALERLRCELIAQEQRDAEEASRQRVEASAHDVLREAFRGTFGAMVPAEPVRPS